MTPSSGSRVGPEWVLFARSVGWVPGPVIFDTGPTRPVGPGTYQTAGPTQTARPHPRKDNPCTLT